MEPERISENESRRIEISALGECLDRLEARVSRVESLLLIERMKNQKPSKEVQGLLNALSKLPQMAPYVTEDYTHENE